MRKDATERRARIIDAAGKLFQELGYDVPLEHVAERAGVGRGTLYRNFADRQKLALAVLEREVENLERLSRVVADDPEGLFMLIRALASIMAVNVRLARAMQVHGKPEPRLVLAARRDKAIERSLQLAKDAGLVSAALHVEDIARAATMVAAPVEFSFDRDQSAEIELSLALLLEGLRAR